MFWDNLQLGSCGHVPCWSIINAPNSVSFMANVLKMILGGSWDLVATSS